jgi:hypothetical protein
VIVQAALILNFIKQFLFNAITWLIVLFLANAFLGLGIGYDELVIITFNLILAFFTADLHRIPILGFQPSDSLLDFLFQGPHQIHM